MLAPKVDVLNAPPAPEVVVEPIPENLFREPLAFYSADHYRQRMVCRLVDGIAADPTVEVARARASSSRPSSPTPVRRCNRSKARWSMVGPSAPMVRERGKPIVLHGDKTNILIAANLHFLAQHRAGERLECTTSPPPLRWELTDAAFPTHGTG